MTSDWLHVSSFIKYMDTSLLQLQPMTIYWQVSPNLPCLALVCSKTSSITFHEIDAYLKHIIWWRWLFFHRNETMTCNPKLNAYKIRIQFARVEIDRFFSINFTGGGSNYSKVSHMKKMIILNEMISWVNQILKQYSRKIHCISYLLPIGINRISGC